MANWFPWTQSWLRTALTLDELKDRLSRWFQPQRFTLVEACLIGLVSGLAAVLLQQGIGVLGTWRLTWAEDRNAPLVLATMGMVGGFTAGWLIERFAPEASGSGIPQVKAALAQFPTRLNGQVAWVKLTSAILALGSGLSLGRQGPTVQIGAALAAQFSYWFPTAPAHRKQMIAAGAGAGLAAGFNTPLAGVLFIVEELLRDLSGLTLGTAILSSFIGAVVARVLGGQSLAVNLSEMATQTSFKVIEIPFYILLGALAGWFGGLFNRSLVGSLNFNQRFLPIGLPWRIALAGLLNGALLGLLPKTFQNNAGLWSWISSGDVSWQVAMIAFVIQFGLSTLAFGAGTPGGVFAPSLVLGAALGDLVGTLQSISLGAGPALTYSLVGMGAFFGAVSRVPFTGIVIIFEMTTDFNLVLPLMISSVMAYIVAEKVSPGSLYALLLKRQGMDLEQVVDTPVHNTLDRLTASDIMQRRVETLDCNLSLQDAKKAFARSHHRGFPVLEQGRLIGILTQTDLTGQKMTNLPETEPIRAIMTTQPVTVAPKDTLSHVLYTLNRFEVSRLPVVERRKLVGIITRADIIRAESEQVTGETQNLAAYANPSYLVYQTQGPATGQGRILVPLANPETAEVLLRLAVAIARDRNYELECVHIIQLPRNRQPAETPVRTTEGRRLLQQAIRYGQRNQVPVHTQIRVGHDIAQTLLEIEKQRYIDLILMGWQGVTPTSEKLFGGTVDVIVRQASSPVLLIKWPKRARNMKLKRWLIPVSGGPNVAQAIQWLPALTQACSAEPELYLCQVKSPQETQSSVLQAYINQLNPQCRGIVRGTTVYHYNVSEAILNVAQELPADAILVGASRENLLTQVFKGSIPETLARGSDSVIFLVRSPTMMDKQPLEIPPQDA
jgi:CIC family chloride channel protein